MHSFGSQLLRDHYAATGWDPDNDYSQLTKPTRALLDLGFVPGLHFSLGKSPVPRFANSASLSVLSPPSAIGPDQRPAGHPLPSPTLTGGVSYVVSGINSFRAVPTRLTSPTAAVDHFSVPLQPPNRNSDQHAPSSGTHTAGDYLLYGRFHLPTYRLDALCTKRLSPTLQALATLVSVPGSPSGMSNLTNQDVPPASHASGPGPSIWNLMLAISHDTGRWSQHYSYSSEDGLFGARVLHNFPATTTAKRSFRGAGNAVAGASAENQTSKPVSREKLVDEEEVMDNVLRGRFSVGGELYFSAQRKSAGVSTGIRFCTIPDPPGSVLTQQPTVISATLNPIMGQISTSYGTKIGPNLALATRFDFNLFSFDSDITFGGEWLQRRPRRKRLETEPQVRPSAEGPDERCWKATDEREQPGLIGSFWRAVSGQEDVLSILRARVSPMTGLTLMWEGRWQECLVGLGITSEFLVSAKRSTLQQKEGFQQPVIKGVCLELQYTADG